MSPLDTQLFTPKAGGTAPSSFENVFASLTLDPRGKYSTWAQISKQINDYFTSSKKETSSVKSTKKDVSKYLHIISTEGILPLDDLADYWGVGNSGDKDKPTTPYSLKLIAKDIITKDNNRATFFVSRHPSLSPATRGTEAIDIFLNYMPPIVASQMSPYLDIEFEISQPPRSPTDDKFGSYTSTPSLMRFLLGTTNQFANSTDASLVTADRWQQARGTSATDATEVLRKNFSGMELFLMPQTLTNMDGLRPDSTGNNRLVPARPFQPFLTIEGLDITVQNAGAGMFAHKKGVLKLKLHDKSRLAEFAEFIRGGAESSTLVWTTYGWISPPGKRGSLDDEFATFINSNMLTRDCWQPVNTQFSFESSGVVSFTIEMVSKNTRTLQNLTLDMSLGDASLKKQFSDLNDVMKKIAVIKDKISKTPKFSISVSASEVLNAASTSGILTDLKDVKDLDGTIKGLMKSLNGSGIVSAQEAKDLSDGLNRLQKKSGKNAAPSLFEAAQNQVTTSVQNKFNKLVTDKDNPDPFLANDYSTGEEKYFPKDLKSCIDAFRNSSVEYQKKIAKTIQDAKSKTTKPITLNSASTVVSFGKLFANFIVPSIINASPKTCDDLQVYFYNLNDECGPASNISIAEFPINMITLGYAYADSLKRLRTDVLTLEQFMKLVIDTQFTDARAIGYGMTKFYKAPDPDKPDQELDKDAKDFEIGMADWTSKYGDLKLPMIEMIIESGDDSMTGANRDIVTYLKRGAMEMNKLDERGAEKGKEVIKRIHIYDKQSNPHRLMQSVIEGKSGIELGNFNSSKLQGSIKTFLDTIDGKMRKAIQEAIDKGAANVDEALKAAGIDKGEQSFGDFTQRPGGQVYEIPRDRKSFKATLMRFVPKIIIGTNGSLITNASVASKTDGLMGAINIINAYKGAQKNTATAADTNLEDPGRLPLRTNPVNITLQTAGVPIATLYQTFFIDFDTGTSIDNIYNCSQIQHGISQGKFVTSWTFIPSSDGYGKFTSPMSFKQIFSRDFKIALEEYNNQLKEKKAPGKPKPAPKATKPAGAK